MTTTVPRKTESGSNARTGMFIAAGLIAAAVIIALIVSLASGDEDATEPVGAGEAAQIPTGSIRQVSFAAIEGEALPRFDATEPVDPAVGQAAPPIVGSYFNNTEVTIEPDDGQPRIILFLAHWCPHCQAEVKTLRDWFAVNGVPTDVELLGISTSVDEGAPNFPPSAWLLREEWPVPVVRDSAEGDLAAGYGLSGFPFIVVVNGDGEIVSRTSGGLTTAQWEAALAAAVGDSAT